MTAPDNACPVEQVAAAIHEADPDVGVSWADWVAYAEEHPLHLQAVEFVRRQAREVLARQRTLPPVAEVMERIAQVLADRYTDKSGVQLCVEPYWSPWLGDARAILAALTNLQTGSAPLTDAGDGGEKG